MTADSPMTMRERLAIDYHWTARQRQVLDLIREGRTNAQIAETLGVSLQGAKWHVTEILTKLNADSREEAAEYWRLYHGMAPRFARVFRGMLGLGAPLKIAIAASVVALVAAASVAALLALDGDDATAPAATPPLTGASPTTTPTTASPTATTTATGSPSPTASPSAVAGASPIVLPGLGAQPTEVKVAVAQALPRDWTLYTWHLPCYQCDGSWADFRRWTGGTATGTFLFSFTTPPVVGAANDSAVYTVGFDSSGQRIAAGLCVRSYCGGGIAFAREDGVGELYLSDDGGRTWRDAGPLPWAAWIVGFDGDEVVIRRPVAGSPTNQVFETYSGKSIEPAGLNPDSVVLEQGRDPVWVKYSAEGHLRSTYVDRGGAVKPPLANTDASLLGLAGADGYVWVLYPDVGDVRPTIIALADRNGSVRKAVRWDDGWLSLRDVAAGRYLAGYGDAPALGTAPTPFMLDLDTATLTPLSGMPRSQAETFSYPMVIAPPP